MLHCIYSRSFINVITFMVLALAAWGAMPAFVGARRWRGGPRADAPDDRLIVGQFCNGLHQLLLVLRVHVGGSFVPISTTSENPHKTGTFQKSKDN